MLYWKLVFFQAVWKSIWQNTSYCKLQYGKIISDSILCQDNNFELLMVDD